MKRLGLGYYLLDNSDCGPDNFVTVTVFLSLFEFTQSDLVSLQKISVKIYIISLTNNALPMNLQHAKYILRKLL